MDGDLLGVWESAGIEVEIELMADCMCEETSGLRLEAEQADWRTWRIWAQAVGD